MAPTLRPRRKNQISSKMDGKKASENDLTVKLKKSKVSKKGDRKKSKNSPATNKLTPVSAPAGYLNWVTVYSIGKGFQRCVFETRNGERIGPDSEFFVGIFTRQNPKPQEIRQNFNDSSSLDADSTTPKKPDDNDKSTDKSNMEQTQTADVNEDGSSSSGHNSNNENNVVDIPKPNEVDWDNDKITAESDMEQTQTADANEDGASSSGHNPAIENNVVDIPKPNEVDWDNDKITAESDMEQTQTADANEDGASSSGHNPNNENNVVDIPVIPKPNEVDRDWIDSELKCLETIGESDDEKMEEEVSPKMISVNSMKNDSSLDSASFRLRGTSAAEIENEGATATPASVEANCIQIRDDFDWNTTEMDTEFHAKRLAFEKYCSGESIPEIKEIPCNENNISFSIFQENGSQSEKKSEGNTATSASSDGHNLDKTAATKRQGKKKKKAVTEQHSSIITPDSDSIKGNAIDSDQNPDKPAVTKRQDMAKKNRLVRNPVNIPDTITVNKQEGKPTIYKCNVCKGAFKTKAQIKYHAFCDTNKLKPFKCETCGAGFITKSHYEYHLRTHTGERPFTCPKCGKGFNQAGKVTRHMLSHTGEKRFFCTENGCGRGFSNRQALQTHNYIHTGEKRYVCKYCCKGFTCLTNLKKHTLTHTGEKPYVCEYCEKNFAQKWSMDFHIKTTHSSDRPFACSECPRKFAMNKDLQRHFSCHSDARPFQCCICGKPFRRKDNLGRHIRCAHMQTKEVAKQLLNASAPDIVMKNNIPMLNMTAPKPNSPSESTTDTTVLNANLENSHDQKMSIGDKETSDCATADAIFMTLRSSPVEFDATTAQQQSDSEPEPFDEPSCNKGKCFNCGTGNPNHSASDCSD